MNVVNAVDGMAAERAFLPAPAMCDTLRAEGIPLFSIESCAPLAEFDAVGITLPHELAATNVLETLDLAGIPLHADAVSYTHLTEAPRGALFHDLTLDAEGRVTHASILTPTAQNVANLEADMRLLAEKLVADGAAEDVVRLEIEKLVRAYDPCLSCSVH